MSMLTETDLDFSSNNNSDSVQQLNGSSWATQFFDESGIKDDEPLDREIEKEQEKLYHWEGLQISTAEN